MQMGMAIARYVASTLDMRLDSTFVRVTPSGRPGYELDTGGEVSEQELSGGSVIQRRVRWQDNELTIRQEIAGFSVADHYSVAVDGTEMVVLRTIKLPQRGTVEVRFVYTRVVS